MVFRLGYFCCFCLCRDSGGSNRRPIEALPEREMGSLPNRCDCCGADNDRSDGGGSRASVQLGPPRRPAITYMRGRIWLNLGRADPSMANSEQQQGQHFPWKLDLELSHCRLCTGSSPRHSQSNVVKGLGLPAI